MQKRVYCQDCFIKNGNGVPNLRLMGGCEKGGEIKRRTRHEYYWRWKYFMLRSSEIIFNSESGIFPGNGSGFHLS